MESEHALDGVDVLRASIVESLQSRLMQVEVPQDLEPVVSPISRMLQLVAVVDFRAR